MNQVSYGNGQGTDGPCEATGCSQEDQNDESAGRRIIASGLWGMARGAVVGAIGAAPTGLGALEGAVVGGRAGFSLHRLVWGTLMEASGTNRALLEAFRRAFRDIPPSGNPTWAISDAAEPMKQ